MAELDAVATRKCAHADCPSRSCLACACRHCVPVVAPQLCPSSSQWVDHTNCVSAECDGFSVDVQSDGVPGGVSPAIVTNGSCKHTAADFDAEAVPLSSFVLNGQDYSKERSMKVNTNS